jgi:hypothetical protein
MKEKWSAMHVNVREAVDVKAQGNVKRRRLSPRA